ncbi:MAG: hypothetical protein PUK00_08210 [Actinobacillus porcinus]|nr:hypothetical protein [Actinobacillus porcinus]
MGLLSIKGYEQVINTTDTATPVKRGVESTNAMFPCGNGKEIHKTERLSGYLRGKTRERYKTAKNKPTCDRKPEKVGLSEA